MTQVRISTPRYGRTENGEELAASVAIDGREWQLWYRTRDGPIADGADPFLTLALLPAMRIGARVRVETPVSPRLLLGIERIKAIFRQRDPSLSDAPVEADSWTDEGYAPGDRGVASMFSGGVDSFFTLYENLDEIDDIVFVHGFDIALDRAWLRRRSSRLFSQVATGLDKRLVQVETNLRAFTNHYADWNLHMHGPAIASVAHVLAPRCRKVLVPGEIASRPGLVVPPMASSWETDPLWSTEGVDIVHHGHQQTRLAKVGAIGGHELVHRALRVCWENKRGAYNCAECSKCLRVMAMLRACGQLDHVVTFGQPLNLELLARVRLSSHRGLLRRRDIDHDHADHRHGLWQTLALLERTGSDPELDQALRDCLAEVHYRGARHLARRAFGRSRRVARAITHV